MAALPISSTDPFQGDVQIVDDLEYAFVRMLEVRVHWGDQLLKVEHLRGGALALGAGTGLPIPGFGRLDVARMSRRGPEIFDPAIGSWSPLPPHGATFALGAFTVSAVLTTECRRIARTGFRALQGRHFALSLALHVVAVLLLAYVVPAFAESEEPVVDQHVVVMRRLLAMADELGRERAEERGVAVAPRFVRESQPVDDRIFMGPDIWLDGMIDRSRRHDEQSTISIRPGTDMVVDGHLPHSVIQRIVRQNYGRFRKCYEKGLRRNSALAGRVVSRFVIDRAGAVSSRVDAGSDFPDDSVIACVVRSFSTLEFPQPEGGVVTVTYPLVFDPGS